MLLEIVAGYDHKTGNQKPNIIQKAPTTATRIQNICRDHCFNNGLVMRAVRDSMITAPPFIITREQVDELFEKAWRSLDMTARDLEAAAA